MNAIQAQSNKISYKETVPIEGTNMELFKRASNWCLGAKVTDRIDEMMTTGNVSLTDNRVIYVCNDEDGFIQTEQSIMLNVSSHYIMMTFTVEIETSNAGYSYTIENFYYRLRYPNKGEGFQIGKCVQYIPLEEAPPSDCKSAYGLAFYKKAQEEIHMVVHKYITQKLVPQLKLWMSK